MSHTQAPLLQRSHHLKPRLHLSAPRRHQRASPSSHGRTAHVRASARANHTVLWSAPRAHGERLSKRSLACAALEGDGVIDAEMVEPELVTSETITQDPVDVYSSEEKIEPVFEPSTEEPVKIVVLGGNGFVGSAICKAAIQQGLQVISVNRSGPPATGEAWEEEVEWTLGDVFDEASWSYHLAGTKAVISCIGGFGSNADMLRINGDATIAAVDVAVAAQIPRFVYISVHDYNIPAQIKSQIGYFDGKQRAEAAVLTAFPTGGVVLKPGFIYGDRAIPQLNTLDPQGQLSAVLPPQISSALPELGGVKVPLGLFGEPLKNILENNMVKNVTGKLSDIPGSDVLLLPPVDVDAVANAALQAALDESMYGQLDVAAIENFN